MLGHFPVWCIMINSVIIIDIAMISNAKNVACSFEETQVTIESQMHDLMPKILVYCFGVIAVDVLQFMHHDGNLQVIKIGEMVLFS